MRICIVTRGKAIAPISTNIPIDRVLHELAERIAQMSHIVDIISTVPSTKISVPYNICSIDSFNLTNRNILTHLINRISVSLAIATKLKELLRRNDYDAILFYAPAPAFLSFLINGDLPPSIFVCGNPTSASDDPKQIRREWSDSKLVSAGSIFLHKRVLRKVDRIIMYSHILKENFSKFFGLEPSKSCVIPPGVDTGLFTPQEKSVQLREKWNIHDDDFVIVCIGGITPRKNQFSLIKAISKLIRKYPNIKLLLVGPILSKEYHQEMESFIERQDLADTVTFTGPVEFLDTPKYYNLASVFALLSTAEGLPRVLLEAMSCGIACIASSIPQNKEVAKEGDEVIFVDPFDIEGIATAIDNLISDSSLRRKLGEKARQTVINYFDWKVIAKQTITMLEEIIKE